MSRYVCTQHKSYKIAPYFILILLCILSISINAQGKIILPSVIADHMVLQRNIKLPIWGQATPGEKITVTFANQNVTTTTNLNGEWMLYLQPLKANRVPRIMTIYGSQPHKNATRPNAHTNLQEKIKIRDILVGEVWICSGQSNMWFQLKNAKPVVKTIPAIARSYMRFFNMKGQAYTSAYVFREKQLRACRNPRNYFIGQWTSCNPKTAYNFSAVGYYFGLELIKALKVPVGLIENASGGAPVESYISRKALAIDPQLRPVLKKDWLNNKQIPAWCRSRARLNLSGDKNNINPCRNHPFKPGFLYDAGVAPLIPFAIRGVIWYQGESNATDTDKNGKPTNPVYERKLFGTLIKTWRNNWHQGNFPFLYVQLPNLNRNWMLFRQMQLDALDIPNTGMAVTIDVGNPTNVHPTNKYPVGKRLALIARAKVYGEHIVYSGPVLKSAVRKNNKLILNFKYTGSGLALCKGTTPMGFEIAGKDGKYAPAIAKIIGKYQIVLFSPNVKNPASLRYAWAPNPKCNLINKEGLPASPFCKKID